MQSQTSRVYVVQEAPGKNILSAKQYGEFKFILPYGQVPMDPELTIVQMKLKMLGFTSDDYLLAIGDPVAIAIACSIASIITNCNFTLLKWDKQERTYHPWRIKT
jgi:hypothetical protein